MLSKLGNLLFHHCYICRGEFWASRPSLLRTMVMKRFRLVLLTSILLLVSLCAQAKGGFGFIGGINCCGAKYESGQTSNDYALYHLGLTYNRKMSWGFAIQPSLLYTAKGAKDLGRFDCIELPVSLQWGLDLLLIRPYIELVPFVGCCLNPGYGFEGGAGVGLGMDFLHFQLSARYSWNATLAGWDMKPRTVSVSLAFMF